MRRCRRSVEATGPWSASCGAAWRDAIRAGVGQMRRRVRPRQSVRAALPSQACAVRRYTTRIRRWQSGRDGSGRSTPAAPAAGLQAGAPALDVESRAWRSFRYQERDSTATNMRTRRFDTPMDPVAWDARQRWAPDTPMWSRPARSRTGTAPADVVGRSAPPCDGGAGSRSSRHRCGSGHRVLSATRARGHSATSNAASSATSPPAALPPQGSEAQALGSEAQALMSRLRRSLRKHQDAGNDEHQERGGG